MITIDQKSFEVKEDAEKSLVGMGMAMPQKTEVKGLAGKSMLTEEVKKIFTKVC